MDFEIILDFTNNVLVLMSLSVVYALFRDERKFPRHIRKIIMGLFVSLITALTILSSIGVSDGVIVDARAVVLMISGMFFGLIPTLMGMISGTAVRIYFGGIGMITGIGWIVVSGTIGLLWRWYRLKKIPNNEENITWVELYVAALSVQMIMLLLVFTLPRESALETIDKVVFPLLVIFPIGQTMVSKFVIILRKQFLNDVDVKESEEQFRKLFKNNTAMLMLIDPKDGMIKDVNDTAINVYGYTLNEFLKLPIGSINLLPPDMIKEKIKKAKEEGKGEFVFQHIKKNGEIMNVEVRTTLIELNGEELLYSTIIDITDRIQNERMFKDADERLRTTLLSVGEGIIVTDEFDRITVVNDKALKLLGKNESLERRKIFEEFRVYSNQSDKYFETIYRECIHDNQMFRSDNTYSLLSNKDDSKIYVDFTISPINNHAGVNHGAIIVIRDVTIEKARQEEIRFMSRHDYLTGLFNRYNFESEMKRLNTKRQLPISIIIGDLNGLKLINDAFGHLEGDKLIKEVSEIFKKATRSEDIVARWGGDEYSILLPQTDEIGAESVKNRIQDLCKKSKYGLMIPSISIGHATKTEEDQDIREILNLAEERMYQEKLTKGPEMRDQLMHRLFEILNTRVPLNLSHADNMITLINKYVDYHQLSEEERKEMILFAKYHDIGRLTVEAELINAPRALTEDEMRKIQTHSETGSRIIATIDELQYLTKPILHHHEWWNGNGYPLGLKGTDIPKKARLLAVIDAYESMTNDRPHRSKMSHDEAINELLKFTGTQFDPKYIKRFIAIFEKDN